MQLEIRRPKALPTTKLRQQIVDAGQLQRKHFISDDLSRRIVSISLTVDQAHAIAELMK